MSGRMRGRQRHLLGKEMMGKSGTCKEVWKTLNCSEDEAVKEVDRKPSCTLKKNARYRQGAARIDPVGSYR